MICVIKIHGHTYKWFCCPHTIAEELLLVITMNESRIANWRVVQWEVPSHASDWDDLSRYEMSFYEMSLQIIWCDVDRTNRDASSLLLASNLCNLSHYWALQQSTIKATRSDLIQCNSGLGIRGQCWTDFCNENLKLLLCLSSKFNFNVWCTSLFTYVSCHLTTFHSSSVQVECNTV